MEKHLYEQLKSFYNHLNEFSLPKLSNNTNYSLRQVQNLATQVACYDKANPHNKIMLPGVLVTIFKRVLENGNDTPEQYLWKSNTIDEKQRIVEYMKHFQINYRVKNFTVEQNNGYCYWSINTDDHTLEYGLMIDEPLYIINDINYKCFPYFLHELCDKATLKHFFDLMPMQELVKIQFDLSIIKRHLLSIHEIKIGNLIPDVITFSDYDVKREWNKNLELLDEVKLTLQCDHIQTEYFKKNRTSSSSSSRKNRRSSVSMDADDDRQYRREPFSMRENKSEHERTSFLSRPEKYEIDYDEIERRTKREIADFWKRHGYDNDDKRADKEVSNSFKPLFDAKPRVKFNERDIQLKSAFKKKY